MRGWTFNSWKWLVQRPTGNAPDSGEMPAVSTAQFRENKGTSETFQTINEAVNRLSGSVCVMLHEIDLDRIKAGALRQSRHYTPG